jgi:histidinol dehydrogenase
MKTYVLTELNLSEVRSLCRRKATDLSSLFPVVRTILRQVKEKGDGALRRYTKRFDGVSLNTFTVMPEVIEESGSRVTGAVKKALDTAMRNIERFHRLRWTGKRTERRREGWVCFSETRPIDKVGFYIPGGTAPLASTVLMLGIPARIAGCREIVLCTPPNRQGAVSDLLLYAAKRCHIEKIFTIGGAQAIAAMGYGTESVPKMDKIFGPGNPYVTAAKMLLSMEPSGPAIDLPAGPSELLVIADEEARADFVASDLLSQAEHALEAHAVFVCTDERKAKEVIEQVECQLRTLPRKEIATHALRNSFALIVGTVEEGVAFSNAYAPEHLILNVRHPERYVGQIQHAGSVFLGPYSCESAGDYASGTNHVLPTYGAARTYSGVSVDSFLKRITFQKVNPKGLKNLRRTITILAEQEGLEGHKRAVEIRCSP